MTGVDIDELLAARQRLQNEKEDAARRGGTVVSGKTIGPAEELTLLRLLGLWLLITGLIVLKVFVVLLATLAETMEWIRREAQVRHATKRKPTKPRSHETGSLFHGRYRR